MAKTLNFFYTFNAGSKTVIVDGNIDAKRLLLITNITRNEIIYNFSAPTRGFASISYNETTDKTTIVLTYDTATNGHQNTDILQIFTEEDSQVFKPIDNLVDPVSKLRISEPNTLIDTDFEYGLQSSKWESLETSNEIPGFYSLTGDIPLAGIVSVTSNGGKIVTITTSSDHGLTTGTPIDVRGLTSISAEGTFLVKKITEYEISYETSVVQPGSTVVKASLITPYTTVVNGRFYINSAINLDNGVANEAGQIETDEQSPSTLTLTTAHQHGFVQKSPFYLTNTLGNTFISFDPSSFEFDGDVEDRSSFEYDTGLFNPYEPEHDGFKINTCLVSNINSNVLTIENHGLKTGDPIAFLGSTHTQVPQINAVSTGRFQIASGNLPFYNNGNVADVSNWLYVNVITKDTFALTTNPESAYNNADLITFNTGSGTWAANGSAVLHFALSTRRGFDIQTDIKNISTVNGSSEVRIELNSKTCKNLNIYPEMQITIDNCGINSLNGVFVVKEVPVGVWATSPYFENNKHFVMEGPTNSSGNLVNQTVTKTYTTSSIAANTDILLLTSIFEKSFSPTITAASASVLTVSTLSNLGNGDLPTRVGSIVRFTNVGSLTGVAINTNYFVSAVTATSITLSSTNPSVSVTPLTIAGTVGTAAVRVFMTGLQVEVHDASNSWLNHSRLSIHDWASINSKMFTKECISNAADKIYSKNHGLKEGTPVIFVGGGNTFTTLVGSPTLPTESATGSIIYHVSIISKDEFELYLNAPDVIDNSEYGAWSAPGARGSRMTLSPTGTPSVQANTFAGGIYQLHPGFIVRDFSNSAAGVSGAGRNKALSQYKKLPAYITPESPIILKANSGSTISTPIVATPNTYESYQLYFATNPESNIDTTYTPSGTGEFSISFEGTGSDIKFTGNATPGAGRFFATRIFENKYSNSFYIPFHGGIAGRRTSYITGSFGGTIDVAPTLPKKAGFPKPAFDYITDTNNIRLPRINLHYDHTGVGGANTTTIRNLVKSIGSGSTGKFLMVPVTDNIFKVSSPGNNIPTGQPTIQIFTGTSFARATSTVAGPLGVTGIQFKTQPGTVINNLNANKIVLPIEKQNLASGDLVRYDTQGGTQITNTFPGVPGLENGSVYTVKNVSDSAYISTGLATSTNYAANATTIVLNASIGTAISIGNIIQFGYDKGTEQALVTNVSGTTLTVQRGYGGTTAQILKNNTTIFKVNGSFQLYAKEVLPPRVFGIPTGTPPTAPFIDTTTNSYVMSLPGHNLTTGDRLLMTSGGGTNPINGLALNTGVNTFPLLVFAIVVDAQRFKISPTLEGAFSDFTIPITTTAATFIQTTESIPLKSYVSSSDPNHKLISVSSTGSLDGPFVADTVSATKIGLKSLNNASLTVPAREIFINPLRSVDLKNGQFIYNNHGFTTGTKIVYSKNGNTHEIGRSDSNIDPRQGYNALYDLALTNVSGNGTQVTYTYATTEIEAFQHNNTVNITGITVGGSVVNGYNGTFKVVSCTRTSVTVANTTTGGSPVTTTARLVGVYFAIRKSANVFQLAKSKLEALNEQEINNFSCTGSVPLEPVQFSITNIARTSNVATITTAAHGLVNGSTFTASIIDVQSLGQDSFDATGITVTVASATTFTYSSSGPNLVSTAASGIVVVGGVNQTGHKFTSSQVFGESLGNGLATIVARDNILNGSLASAVSSSSERIILTNHGFVTGDRIIYQVWGNGAAINGLISGSEYFINNTTNPFVSGPLSRGGSASGQSLNQFSLHKSWVGAYTNTDIVDIRGSGVGTIHQFKLSNPVLKGTKFVGEWSAVDNYVYGDVVSFRGDNYMSISGNSVTAVFNINQQPISNTVVYNNHWMLLPTLPSYTTKFLTQYKGNDIVSVSNTLPLRTVPFSGTSVSTTTGVFSVSAHNLTTGDAVIYRIDAQGGGHGGASALANNYVSNIPQRTAAGSLLNTNNDKLIPNAVYYVNAVGVNNFTLHSSPSGSFYGNSASSTANLYTTGISITNIARTSNIATINTAAHGLIIGQTYLASIDVTTAGQDGFDAQFTTVTVTSATVFTYTNTGGNVTSVAGTGTFKVHDTTDLILPGTAFAGTGSTHRLEKIEGKVYTSSIIAINNDNEMIISDPYPSRQIIFNPQDVYASVTGLITSTINLEREEIYIKNHGLSTGTKVYYSAGFNIGFPIGGLTEGGTYFVHRVNNDIIKLCGDGLPSSALSSLSNALLGIAVNLTSTGQGFNHYLIAATICGSSNIRYTSAGALSADTQGTGVGNAGIANSNYYSGQVAAHIRDGVLQAVPFVYTTNAYIRSNCLNLHRPFDGGVEIQAAKNPLISIVRQTRRYFRYQSGKGLQYSTGMNFSPSMDIASITHDGSTYATVVTRRPHNLSANNKIIVENVEVSSGSSAPYNTPSNGTNFVVNNIIDEFTFRYATNGLPADVNPSGFPALFVYEWQDAFVRAGMFDDQNGMFYEYDGQQMYCVRRNATAQLSGTLTTKYNSNIITGTNTKFTRQLASRDRIVVRGMTYRITAIESDTAIHISQPYRGTSGSRIVGTKVVNLRVPQSEWNLDKCDGTGPSGLILNVNRMQMAYMDYSWYGAGKVRFGFKGKNGEVMYVHQFVHNNKEIEAYMRSGNLPARYEIETGVNPTFSPSLYHWGASVIMDGKFEDDKAYLFTVASGSAGSDTISIPATLAGQPIPILSLRLAPSVDSSIVGKLGDRDLINRMILAVNSCGIVIGNTNSKPASVRLILNGGLAQAAFFTNYGSPSLTQIIKHTGQAGDGVTGGTTVFEFRAPVNSPVVQDLTKLLELGNSILGGDFVFPNGPDSITLAVVPTDTAAPTTVTARFTWTESQA